MAAARPGAACADDYHVRSHFHLSIGGNRRYRSGKVIYVQASQFNASLHRIDDGIAGQCSAGYGVQSHALILYDLGGDIR